MFNAEVTREPVSRDGGGAEKPPTYDCDLCDSGDWLSETEVEVHKKTMHLADLHQIVAKQSNVCLTCVKCFPDDTTLVEHIKTIHLLSSKTARRVEREIFVCDHCDELFFNKRLLAFHIHYRHIKKPTGFLLNCPLCHKKKSCRKFMSHLIQHEAQGISVCPICVRKQQNTKALALHTETHQKHYHCNVCGYISIKEKDFNLHLDRYQRRKAIKTPNVRNYRDYFLLPRFRQSWFYRNFRIGVQGLIFWNKIYICVLCREICTSLKGMADHVAQIHLYDTSETVIKKVCTCGESFTNKVLLKHHILKMKGDHKLQYMEFADREQNALECELQEDVME
ncbi:protein suppressor of hairy wing-like [Ostrinia nubilalis]|uniref:protein suppressor of hairy wing-like n=1 Tax=Ostrinia nubilalis TaxID=29057 RepID=UPI00308255EA